MRYRVLLLLLATALAGCTADSFGMPRLRDNAGAPAWREPLPFELPPLQRLPAPTDDARA